MFLSYCINSLLKPRAWQNCFKMLPRYHHLKMLFPIYISSAWRQVEVKNTVYCYQSQGKYNMSGSWCWNYYLFGCFSAAGMSNSGFTPRATISLCYSVKNHLSLISSTTVNFSATRNKANTVTLWSFTGHRKWMDFWLAVACSVNAC